MSSFLYLNQAVDQSIFLTKASDNDIKKTKETWGCLRKKLLFFFKKKTNEKEINKQNNKKK